MPPPRESQIVERHPVDREAIDALEADAVVLAVDGMTDALAPELAPWVAPMRGQVIATDPLPERLYDRPHYARGGYDYWQQLADGTLILGGRRDTSLETEQTARRGDDHRSSRISSTSFAGELIGRPVPIAHRWAGIWGQTFDLLPFAGRVPGSDRLWVAGGYSATATSSASSAAISSRERSSERPTPELGLFDPARVGEQSSRARRASGLEPQQ